MAYTRGRELGIGGQAQVYLSRRNGDGMLVAEKVMLQQNYQHKPIHLHLLKKIGSQCPCLVKALEIPTANSPNAVIEYCNGGDLDTLIKARKAQNHIPEAFIWHVFSALARALAFLHNGAGTALDREWTTIVHRDIKSANVLLKQNPEDPDGFPLVKLADFDLAGFYNEEDPHFTGVSFAWQPPEQWCDRDYVRATPAGDIWALGSIIHALACGRAPGQAMKKKEKKSDVHGPLSTHASESTKPSTETLESNATKVQSWAESWNEKPSTQTELPAEEFSYCPSDLGEHSLKNWQAQQRERVVEKLAPCYSQELETAMLRAFDMDENKRATAQELVNLVAPFAAKGITGDMQDFLPFQYEEVPEWEWQSTAAW